MKIGENIHLKILTNGGVVFNLLDSGDIFNIEKEAIQLNLLKGNNIEGSNSNLYLRIFDASNISYTKMIGVDSPSTFEVKENRVIYNGSFKGVTYQVILTVLNDHWFYEVFLDSSNQATKVDVVYGQDVAIADKGAVNNNEAYTCQYIDHKAFETDLGYVVASRQNQGTPHYLQQGSLTKNIAYSTDGFQFFGIDYKTTNEPKALKETRLANENYQYEYAYTALQSEKLTLKKPTKVVFYGVYKDAIHEVAKAPRFMDEIKASYAQHKNDQKVPSNGYALKLKLNLDHTLSGLSLDEDTIASLYPNRRHVEKKDDTTLSFFTDNQSHVVLKAKELLVERPHGNMVITGKNSDYTKPLMASTHFMFGLFNSHIVVGNTNFNKMSSNLRSPLNTAKLSGQRIFIEIDGSYKLLTMPSLFEVGMNYSKWIYKLKDDTLTIKSAVAYDANELLMDVRSEENKKYNFIVINHLVMGANEYEHPIMINNNQNIIEILPSEHAMCTDKTPDLKYLIKTDQAFKLSDDAVFYEDNTSRNQPVLSLQFDNTDTITIKTQGLIDGKSLNKSSDDIDKIISTYYQNYRTRINDFNLSIDNDKSEEVDKFNDLAMWYTHNAHIHYASPHGLEQYSGAAWGTRDICQGPAEYFSVTQDYKTLRNVILKVYTHQFKQNGDWPQWFMFDAYHHIQAHESHGDVIVWPLRTLALYLESTGDYSILDEVIPYMDLDTSTFTNEKETLAKHVKKQIETIESNFIEGTYLSTYGGGDWDDTLQPANQALTKSLVSGWTVALTYEAFNLFAKEIASTHQTWSETLSALAQNIKKDYFKYIIRDNVPAGFLLFEKDNIKAIVHPDDQETGLKYRLLPFNRGFISEMFEPEKIKPYMDLIDQHLKYPDGVRLMDHTVKYKGGINTYFQRAETASNFGREIGLQYVHAHIRYIETLAKLGNTDTWDHLQRINPILIDQKVKNAIKRQSNTYFSSSDGNFKNRYEAMEHFDDLKTGKVGVKGGWRIYSSGPGIYLNQLISNTLGIRSHHKDLVLDPVLPTDLNGLVLNYAFNGLPIEVHYHIKENKGIKKVLINQEPITYKTLENPYRHGGALIKQTALIKENNHPIRIDVYM